MSNTITVLGIDPGSRCTGWGVVQETSGVARLIDCGTVRAAEKDMTVRLGKIFHGVSEIIRAHGPDIVSIENVFVSKNAMSALKLGQARGAAIAACAQHSVSVVSYEPTKVKQTIVGTGRASKEQVSFMVAQILAVKQPKWALDTSDALGLAICHLNMRRFTALAGR